VEANDIGDVSAPQILTPPTNGTAEVTASILYTPDSEFVGLDSFSYTICSTVDVDVCATATVRVAVGPLATSDVLSTVAGVTATVDVLVNDTAGPAPIATIVSGPAEGSASITAGVLTFTSLGTFTGHDSVLYEVCAQEGSPLCARAEVSIEVSPDLNHVVTTTDMDSAVTVDVTFNDFGDAGAPVVSRPPANGTVTGGGLDRVRAILGTGNVDLNAFVPLTYTPNPGFVGPDAFAYVRCAESDTSLCSQAVVLVVVQPTAIPPTQPGPPLTNSGVDQVPERMLVAALSVALGSLLLAAPRRRHRARHSLRAH
jgi:hypothetical protein